MGEAQLDLLARILARVDEYARDVTRQQLDTDLDTWLMVSRALELVGQCCVDLALELVAARGLGAPATYREAFVRLAQAGVLSPEHADTLQGWAGLRNVLAHQYTVLDLDRVYEALLEDKTAVRALARAAADELLGT